jgi:hypothetical protein
MKQYIGIGVVGRQGKGRSPGTVQDSPTICWFCWSCAKAPAHQLVIVNQRVKRLEKRRDFDRIQNRRSAAIPIQCFNFAPLGSFQQGNKPRIQQKARRSGGNPMLPLRLRSNARGKSWKSPDCPEPRNIQLVGQNKSKFRQQKSSGNTSNQRMSMPAPSPGNNRNQSPSRTICS